jgi:phospholipid-binding lipoprotein MlaA
MKRIFILFLSIFWLGSTVAYASPVKKAGQPTEPYKGDEEHSAANDVLEPLNRVTFAVNDGIDALIVNPLVTVWNGIIPSFARAGIGNFFNNLDDIYVGFNHFLQGNGIQAGTDFKRVAVNSTIGLAGFLDVGTKMGMPKSEGDFGQTLGVWGAPTGPYLILPLIGPSTLRETAGRAVRVALDPRTYLEPVPSYSSMGLEYIQTRADAKANENLIAASSLDRYVFVRNLYLQKRSLLINANKEKAE